MGSIFGKRNMGVVDRCIRIVMGLVMIYVGFVDQSILGSATINTIISVIGIASILFAFIAFCPLYTLGDVSTIKKSPDNG